MHIGFIGLGAMGRPIAERLLDTGYNLSVYDSFSQAMIPLADQGARKTDSPRAAARDSEITFTCLPNAHIVSDAMLGNNGVFAGASKGSKVIDISSVEPYTTKRLAGDADQKGIDYLDAPVSGGVKGAAAGNLTIMVGASKETFKRVKPVLKVFGRRIYHVGAVGAGHAMKIINNMLLGMNMAALAEAMVLGVKLELDPNVMSDVISQSSGRSYVSDVKLPEFILKGNFRPGFMLDLQYKDLNMAHESGKHLQMPLPMTSQALGVFETARSKGYGPLDVSSVVKIWEDLMKTAVRRKSKLHKSED